MNYSYFSERDQMLRKRTSTYVRRQYNNYDVNDVPSFASIIVSVTYLATRYYS